MELGDAFSRNLRLGAGLPRSQDWSWTHVAWVAGEAWPICGSVWIWVVSIKFCFVWRKKKNPQTIFSVPLPCAGLSFQGSDSPHVLQTLGSEFILRVGSWHITEQQCHHEILFWHTVKKNRWEPSSKCLFDTKPWPWTCNSQNHFKNNAHQSQVCFYWLQSVLDRTLLLYYYDHIVGRASHFIGS